MFIRHYLFNALVCTSSKGKKMLFFLLILGLIALKAGLGDIELKVIHTTAMGYCRK